MREFDLLQYVYETTGPHDGRVVVGPGDDMALVRLEGTGLLAAVDQVVEHRHFARGAAPELVGRKAVARSLSDIAAMAGRPLAALAAATLPPAYGTERARRLFDGMRQAASAAGCPLVGGDIAFHGRDDDPLTCSVTVLAEPGPAGAVLRRGARKGDIVYVTGTLGGSSEGDRHLVFEPRIREAIELAATLGDRLHAMIDVSDGLGRDAAHLASDSDVRLEIDATLIPRAPDVTWRRAASEGEDYELLFAATGDVPREVGDALAVTAIGRVAAAITDDGRGGAGDRAGEGGGGLESARVVIRDGATLVAGDDLGWEHAS